MKPIFVGIAGGKGEGKDALAQIIIDAFPFDAVRLAFADALKREVAEACEVPVIEIEQNKAKFRPILQWWGTEFRREHQDKPNYWIEMLNLYASRYDGSVIVIPDVRFPNEYDYVMQKNGIVVKATRDIFRDKFSEHASETSLRNHKFDFTIVNNGTLEQLADSAGTVIQMVKNKLAL